jgi:hypothetical protein
MQTNTAGTPCPTDISLSTPALQLCRTQGSNARTPDYVSFGMARIASARPSLQRDIGCRFADSARRFRRSQPSAFRLSPRPVLRDPLIFAMCNPARRTNSASGKGPNLKRARCPRHRKCADEPAQSERRFPSCDRKMSECDNSTNLRPPGHRDRHDRVSSLRLGTSSVD